MTSPAAFRFLRPGLALSVAVTLIAPGAAPGAGAWAGHGRPMQEPPPVTSVTLPEGRRLALLCLGEGTPTVVVDAGLGGQSTVGPWKAIAEDIAKTTRICLHDRAGLGESDAVEGERTSADVVRDLHDALEAASERGPFVLVGHSVGGLNMRVFAGRYPSDVAGLVLVDATHPDQIAAWRSAFPPFSPDEATAVAQARAHLSAMEEQPSANPERLNLNLSSDQAREVRVLSVPVVVLSHSPNWRMVPDLPDTVLGPIEAESRRLQHDLLTLSERASQRVSVQGGHDLPAEDPDLVVEGILQAVRSVEQ